MIDVSRFHVGDRCPRCVERRVFAVDLERNLWRCVPNAMPVPWLREHMIEHDAAEWDEFPAVVRQANAEIFMRLLATTPPPSRKPDPVIEKMMEILMSKHKAQHPRGDCNGR